MAASLAQINANRQNARESTGPKTPEGKAVSRQNGLEHGMTGRGIVMSDPMRLTVAAIERRLAATHQPVDPVAALTLGEAAISTLSGTVLHPTLRRPNRTSAANQVARTIVQRGLTVAPC